MPSSEEADAKARGVVFKKYSEVDVEPISNTVFSGTSLNYFNSRFKLEGNFSHPGGTNVFLSNDLGEAWTYARNRSDTFNDEPIILVVNSQYRTDEYIPERRGIQKDIVCKIIPKEAILGVYKVGSIKESDLLFLDDPFELLNNKGEEVEIV